MDSSDPTQPGAEPEIDSSDRLDSWKEIAAFLKRDVRTVQRWEKKEGLPVHRHLHEKLGAVYGFRSEISAWWRERSPDVLEKEPQAEAVDVRRPTRRIAVASGVILAVALLYLGPTIWEKARNLRAGDTQVRSLAVLPLKNLSAASDQNLVEGMHDALITDLAKISTLRVISRTSSARVDTRRPLAAIGKELGVEAVIEGSVMRSGNRVRVTAQLVRVRDEHHLWAEAYDRDEKDSLTLIGEVAQSIADAIQVRLSAEEHAQIGGRSPANSEAQRYYLLGRSHLNQRTIADLVQGAEFFEQAIRLDPNYAPAHAGLADAYMLLGSFSYDQLDPRVAMPKAKEAALRALKLDRNLSEARVTLANIHLIYDWDFAAAEKGFRNAEIHDPNNSIAHHWYARRLIQTARWEEAFREISHAQKIDPLSLPVNIGMAWHYYMHRRFDDAIGQCRKVLEIDNTFLPARLVLGMAYEQKGMYEQAMAEVRSDPGFEANPAAFDWVPAVHSLLGRIYARAGRRAEAENEIQKLTVLSRKRYVPALYFAIVYAALGNEKKAFEYLEKSYEERNEGLLYLNVEPGFDHLRSDPRFQSIFKRIGLPIARPTT